MSAVLELAARLVEAINTVVLAAFWTVAILAAARRLVGGTR